jgi:hypothetical protein
VRLPGVCAGDTQDAAVNEMKQMIRALQDDCRSLANAISQFSAGAELTSVLQALPPTLVQVGLRACSAWCLLRPGGSVLLHSTPHT